MEEEREGIMAERTEWAVTSAKDMEMVYEKANSVSAVCINCMLPL